MHTFQCNCILQDGFCEMKFSRETLDLSDFLLSKLILILLTETVSYRKEFPGPLLVHLPHVRFLVKMANLSRLNQNTSKYNLCFKWNSTSGQDFSGKFHSRTFLEDKRTSCLVLDSFNLNHPH